jgi:hypothetical protein
VDTDSLSFENHSRFEHFTIEAMPKVIWLKPIRGRYGKTVQRIEATLAVDELGVRSN